ncbi:MAG: hypothetical protein ABFC94_00890 [Syntrophomonas sp.]
MIQIIPKDDGIEIRRKKTGNLEKAIERIKVLECPTGEVENRVVGILEDFKVANRNMITISREEQEDGLEAYSAVISSNKEHHITVLAKSGLDDYVATVVDACID